MTEVVLFDGRVLKTHGPDTCNAPSSCPIHNPSEHPLRNAPMDWYPALSHLVRICEHGLRHPDPDDLRVKVMSLQLITVEAISSVHLVEENCDGCCRP